MVHGNPLLHNCLHPTDLCKPDSVYVDSASHLQDRCPTADGSWDRLCIDTKNGNPQHLQLQSRKCPTRKEELTQNHQSLFCFGLVEAFDGCSDSLVSRCRGGGRDTSSASVPLASSSLPLSGSLSTSFFSSSRIPFGSSLSIGNQLSTLSPFLKCSSSMCVNRSSHA